MERQTSDIRTEFTAASVMEGALDYEAFCRHRDDSLEHRAQTVIERLDQLGFQVVPKPIQGLNIVLNAEGAEAIKEAAASAGASDPRVVGFSERPHPAPQRWVLAQVVPGEVSVGSGADAGFDSTVTARATATVIRFGGKISGERREISVVAQRHAHEGGVGDAARDAMAQAMVQAREAATGFIEAANQPLPAAA